MKIVDLIFTIGFGAITTYIISLAGLFNFWTLYDYSYSDANPNVNLYYLLLIFKANATGCGTFYTCFLETFRRGW